MPSSQQSRKFAVASGSVAIMSIHNMIQQQQIVFLQQGQVDTVSTTDRDNNKPISSPNSISHNSLCRHNRLSSISFVSIVNHNAFRSKSRITSAAACESLNETTTTTTRPNDTPTQTRNFGKKPASSSSSSSILLSPPVFPVSSYPNLSRHSQHSALRQFLTLQVYEQLYDQKTTSGIGLEDIIRAGVALPHGAYRRGVYAGDAECYDTFHLLFAPIIAQRHNLDTDAAATTTLEEDDELNNTENTANVTPMQQQQQQHRRTVVQLQKFRTNLDPEELIQQQIDPQGDYILFTRMRLARSIQGFRFSPCITRAERRQVEHIVKSCVGQWEGSYTSVMDLTNKQHHQLVRSRTLFGDPDEHAIAAGFGRDWPDARGFYSNIPWDTSSSSLSLSTSSESPKLIIWCNAKDHMRIISRDKGGNVQAVFSRLSRAVRELEYELNAMGYQFVEHRRLGFLNSSPSDIGTALRASVVIKLVRLGRHPQFETIVQKLHLEVAAKDDSNRQYSGIFDLGNTEALGKTEVQLINMMIDGVGKLIELERRLEQGGVITQQDIDALHQ